MPTLSKSTFLRGTQCQKSLYLNWHQPELKDPVPPMRQAIFSQGHEIGKLAQQLFPGGTDAGIFVPDHYQKSIELTARLISEGCPVIYEAGFNVGDLHCFIDILVKDGDKWKAFEVKSSTQVKQVNVLDASFQYYVMKNSGLDISEISLIIIDNTYTRQGELDIRKLFRIEPLTLQVLNLQHKVEELVGQFLNTLNSKEVPVVDIGPHCSDPYDCDFHGHCWQHVPEYSIFNIARLDARKKWELYEKGILRFEDIPPDFKLNDSQWQQVLSELKGETHIDKKAIRRFLDGLEFPLYFLDFESFQPAVPLFDRSRPYQQVVFQYSLHIRESENSDPIHKAFLAQSDGTDPRIPFITNLINDVGTKGSIIVFNRSFEASRLNEIAANYLGFETPISNIVSRIKDLMLIFQGRHYYVPEMKGSFSIKQVLPALVPGFSYDNLPIADGGSASHAFMSLIGEKDAEKIQVTRKNLLDYCQLDTLAMVKILEVLYKIA